LVVGTLGEEAINPSRLVWSAAAVLCCGEGREGGRFYFGIVEEKRLEPGSVRILGWVIWALRRQWAIWAAAFWGSFLRKTPPLIKIEKKIK
jgi:hypothetical protein